MKTFVCMNCGDQIKTDDNITKYECLACGTVYDIQDLIEYKKKTERIVIEVKDELNAEVNEKKRRQAEEDAAKIRLMDAQSKALIIEAQNKGKPQTVIYNGPDTEGIATNAVNAFTGKDFKAAFIAAREALVSNAECIVALFIVAYEDYAIKKKMFAMDNFFAKLEKSADILTSEDVSNLEKVFAVATMKLTAYEEKVLRFVYDAHGGNTSEANEVCSFVDRFSPYCISTRTNHMFLTNELETLYKKFSAFCSVPKTCYALVGAIQNNPESPLKNEQYFLRERNLKFYNEFVLKVGEIISVMKDGNNRAKFVAAFEKISAVYRQKAKIN